MEPWVKRARQLVSEDDESPDEREKEKKGKKRYLNTVSPFAKTTFGKPTTMGFGTPATFGQSPTPLFGNTNQQGSLFSPPAQTSAFGQSTTQQGTFGMFGGNQPQQSSTGIFGNTATPAFGQQNKSAGFGYRTSSNDTFFKQPANQQAQQGTPSLFGQPTPNLFGSPSGFSNSPSNVSSVGTVIKFTPVTGTDTMVKGSINQTISTRHHCITCMKEYETKSLEELRWEDYQANRKGPQQGAQPSGSMFGNMSQPASGSVFGGGVNTAPTNSIFGQTENKPVFGSPSAGGMGVENTAVFPHITKETKDKRRAKHNYSPPRGSQIMFSSPTESFGQNPTVFGSSASTNAPNLFAKPLGTFTAGTPTTSAFPFSSSSQTNLFGSNTTVKPFNVAGQQNNLFGQQQTTGFGSPPSFGSFGSQPSQSQSVSSFGSFGQPATQSTGLFTANKPANQGFGAFGSPQTNTPVFGQGSFGNANSSTMFNSNFKTPTPLFGQTNTNQQIGLGLNSATPSNTSVFGTNTMKSGNMFGNTGMFNSGFGNVPFNMGGNMAQPGQVNQDITPMSVQDKILTVMAAMPYGNCPLFNNLPDVPRDIDIMARPTNPGELSRLLNTVKSKPPVANPARLQPIQLYGRKKPMFNGLEQADNTITNFQLVTNPKRLIISKGKGAKDDPVITPSESPWQNTNPGIDSIEPNLQKVADDNIDANNSNSEPTEPKEDQVNGNKVISPDISVIADAEEEEQFAEASDVQDWNLTESFVGEEEMTTTPVKPPNVHPTGIVLTRSDYYTVPSLDELVKFIAEDGSCVVKGFTIGRVGYGNVYFPEAFDVSNLNLDELVHFRNKEITIYPDDTKKPPQGKGLNRKAQVTLDKMYPFNKETKMTVTDPIMIAELNYTDALRRVCEKQETKFIDYRPDTGSWVFKVNHFSRYGLHDSDDSDDEIKPENIATKKDAAQNTEMQEKVDKACETNTSSVDLQKNVLPMEAMDMEDAYMNYMADRHLTGEPISSDFNSFQVKYSMGEEPVKYKVMKASLFYDELEDVENFSFDENEPEISIREMSAYVDSCSPTRAGTGLLTLSRPAKTSRVPRTKAMIMPQVSVIRTFNGIIPMPNIRYNHRNIADMAAFKGRSFKVGWGRNMTLLCLTAEQTFIEDKTSDSLFTSRAADDYSPSLIRVVQIEDEFDPENIYTKITDHLESQLSKTKFLNKDGIPHCESIDGFEVLEAHIETSENLENGSKYWLLVWQLCNTLWGNIEHEDLHNYSSGEIRRNLFSNWLKVLVHGAVKNDMIIENRKDPEVVISNMLTNMSGLKITAATELAFKNNFFNLAMLLSGVPSSQEIRILIEQQLVTWFDSTANFLIPENLIRLYMIVAGRPYLQYEDQQIHVCEKMDWMRTLAIYFWYFCPPSESISMAVQMYEESFKKSDFVSSPLPLHNKNLEYVHDLLFHILKFHSDDKYPLVRVLNPVTHTDNPLDFSMSWFLSETFMSLQLNNMADTAYNYLHVNFAAQLESMNLWHWSVFVLLFIKDSTMRKSLIMEVLNRHVEILGGNTHDYLEREMIIVHKFHIPSQWLDSAKATQALLQRNYKLAVHYLSYAERWAEAHDVIVEHFFPDHFLSHDYDYLAKLLMPMEKIHKTLPAWEERGGLILDFAKLAKKYKNTIAVEDPAEVKLQMSNFDTEILKMTQRIKRFPCSVYLHNICLAEMSSSISMMLRHTLCVLGKSNNPMERNVEFERLFTIPLPADYLQEEIQNILVEFQKEQPMTYAVKPIAQIDPDSECRLS